MRFIKMKSILR